MKFMSDTIRICSVEMIARNGDRFFLGTLAADTGCKQLTARYSANTGHTGAVIKLI